MHAAQIAVMHESVHHINGQIVLTNALAFTRQRTALMNDALRNCAWGDIAPVDDARKTRENKRMASAAASLASVLPVVCFVPLDNRRHPWPRVLDLHRLRLCSTPFFSSPRTAGNECKFISSQRNSTWPRSQSKALIHRGRGPQSKQAGQSHTIALEFRRRIHRVPSETLLCSVPAVIGGVPHSDLCLPSLCLGLLRPPPVCFMRACFACLLAWRACFLCCLSWWMIWTTAIRWPCKLAGTEGGNYAWKESSASCKMTTSLLLQPALGAAAFSMSLATAKCHSNNHRVVTRCSKSEGPLRRPSLNAPPASPSTLPPPSPPTPSTPPAVDLSAAAAPPAMPSSSSKVSGVTIEFQRQRAKEMQEYFLDKKFEDQTSQQRIFGWTRKNEISNGRWVMFGLAVGLLTEFATGSDFVEQLKIIVSNLGILDLD